MKLFQFALAATVTLAVSAGVVTAHDGPKGKSHKNRLAAALKPSEEVPVVSSAAARGSFKATIDEVNQVISYELSYEGLEAAPGQAHIHVGQKSVNGGVSVFLCGNAPTVPPAAFPQPPACPAAPATITGEIRPAQIVGPAGQGVAASTATTSEFAELIELLRDGDTYANVHTAKFPGGEIRGQVVALGGHDHDD